LSGVYNDLISPSHKVTRGSIGIQFREGFRAPSIAFTDSRMAFWCRRFSRRPGRQGRLKAGDIITTVDGRPIKDGDDLVNEIASRRPGSTIRLGYVRDGKSEDTTVTIGDRDKVFADINNPQPQSNDDNGSGAGEAKLGIVVQDAPPATVSRIHTSGVLVESVRTGSFADLQGLEPGLVITHINRQPTPNKEQFDAVVSKLKTGDDVVFEVIDPHHPEQGINYIGGTL
jgi:serine protease Do